MVRTCQHRFALALAMIVAPACGGGDEGITPPPPPPPVVTSVDVSPASRALLVGDTLTLVATVRDQHGAVMQGVTVAWSSDNAAVASVSGLGKVTALVAGDANISATANGKTGSAALTITRPVPTATVEPSARVTATIGPDGGTLQATSSTGTQYALEIPAGALLTTQEIRMTPVAGVTHLGLSGGLAGAVDLQPSGLVFVQPARLRMVTSQSAPVGTQLTGFSASSDFSQRELSFTKATANELVVLVSHFSITGAGFGTTAEVSQFVTSPAQSLEAIFNQVIAISPNPWNAAGVAQATQLAQQAFDQIVLPALNSAANDAALLDAVSDYVKWRILLAMIEFNGLPPIVDLTTGLDILGFPVPFVDRAQAGVDAAADGIRLAIDANAVICGDQGSMAALRNVFFWYGWAERLHADVAPNGLDPVTFVGTVRSKCATVVLKNSNLPDSLPGGQNFNLDLNFALRFRNGAEVPSDFRVDLAPSGVSVTNPSGFTGIGNAISPVGYYTTVINPATSLGFRLRSSTCFVPSRATPAPSALCETFELTKVVYFNDFESSVGNEWSLVLAGTSPSGRQFLGVFSNNATILTVDSIPQHTMLSLEFDLYIIGSWNGNAEMPVAGAPDILEFSIEGGGSLKKTTFSNKFRDRQAYPGDFPGSSFPNNSGAAETGTLGYPGVGGDFFGDAVYNITLTFPHTAASVKLKFNANHNGEIERWGLDNVRVKVVQP